MNASPTVLVSLDGLAPRFITPERMPHLAGLVRSGGGCFTARTVRPPLTAPVHASMLRGVAPETHGVMDNSAGEIQIDAPSILGVARAAGLSTLSATSWQPIDALIEAGAATHRVCLDSGYESLDDEQIIGVVEALLASQRPDVIWIYLSGTDLAGHQHGWGGDGYLEAMTAIDAKLGRLLRAVGDDASVVVTTDQGGIDHQHDSDTDEVLDVFVALRSPTLAAGSMWIDASVLDIAPTIADLAGVVADPAWQGQSLLGRERSMVDHLLDLLRESDRHHYGESVTMLEHALQCASEVGADASGDDELVLAALLHDIGHVVGTAGAYGHPDHAEIGAAWLAPWLPDTVSEPIRLHVAAKRHLVGVDPEYADQLSEASRVTLEQQGGAFSAAESIQFLHSPHTHRAMRLRRCDDLGKRADVNVQPLEDHRERIVKALATAPIDPVWARDACRCGGCRDVVSDQHLIDAADLSGWRVRGSRRLEHGLEVDLIRSDGTEHTAKIPSRTTESAPLEELWDTAFSPVPRNADDIELIATDVARHGLALADGIGLDEGAVLTFASSLGFVRETNYGALFDVRAEASAINLAYTPVGLPLHTDNPYREPTPTVQVLHCIVPAAAGGANRLADGFAAAKRLRQRDPEAFGLLASTNVRFRFHSDDVDLVAERSVIECGDDGSIKSVALNHRSLDTPADSPLASALCSFMTVLDAMAIEITLGAGQAIVFDNRRILHARTAFDPSAGRHLQGCYIDIDSLQSMARLATAT